MKKVFEGVVEYTGEDGGKALIATICDEVPATDGTMFVRIQSWDDKPSGEDEAGYEVYDHAVARQFEGKRVRVTVEVI